jgi:hypothetical protein
MKVSFNCPRPMPYEIVDAFLEALDRLIAEELEAVPERLRAVGEDDATIAHILRLASEQMAGQRAMLEREAKLDTSH